MHPLEMLFVAALFLYSFVIWSHKFSRRMDLWMVWLFGFGLIADIGGTVLLCVAASARWVWTPHTVSGLASLLIMALHFMWAVLATGRESNWKIYFDRYSVYAWCFWMFAFISGIPR